MRSVVRRLAAGVVWLLAVTPLFAHHEILAKFDSTKPRTLAGVVTRVDWVSPHVHVFMNVAQASRQVNWAVELESPVDLERSGWNRNTLKPGDGVTVQGISARDGSMQLWGNSISLTTSGRKVLGMSAEAMAATKPSTNNQSARPAPRGPDGKPRLSAAPGEVGYWGRPSSTSLMETGISVQTDANGLLKNLKDVDKVAPFQKWARDLYEYRQRNFLKDDPMFQTCKPAGAVRQFQLPYGNQFLEEKELGRVFVMAGGSNHEWHFIYTDARPQTGDIRGNDTNPLYYGNARGRWDGDTFVVDTKGLNEKFWMSNGGLPHTEQLHLVERFTRTDTNTLKYEVTIDDPGAYTRTWTASWTLQWVPEDLPTVYCQDNRP